MSFWRVFSTNADCQAWCDGEWVAMARERSLLNGGMLNDFSADGVPVDVTVLADSEITPERFPLWGMRDGVWNTEDGFTTAWAIPRETATGEWAALCRVEFDESGMPEPEWPVPVPPEVPVSEELPPEELPPEELPPEVSV